ncbi:MAG: hypothetical protein Ct9H300mP28_37920 [Pseudomonadota bacterium]|nr:MAG: hypothetical protein Ct9H300mP28_37920 [Pseudomonadota bacterium]
MPKPINLKWNALLILLLIFGFAGSGLGQEDTDSISTVVIDSAPKKLYSELYSEKTATSSWWKFMKNLRKERI